MPCRVYLGQDKTDLVRWIFATAALHPDVGSISAVSSEQRTTMSRTAAQLFERLLTVTCRKETKAALKYEGAMAMQQSFQVLGQVAMTSLMAHPTVQSGFGEMSKFVDEKKIEALPNSPD